MDKNLTYDELFQKGEAYLTNAKKELFKPEEDVVAYSVCKNANEAIINYLSGYLVKNNCELPETKTVKDLLSSCREAQSDFKDLHLAPFYNPTDTEDPWMNMDMAKDFIVMAEKTRDKVSHLTKTPKTT